MLAEHTDVAESAVFARRTRSGRGDHRARGAPPRRRAHPGVAARPLPGAHGGVQGPQPFELVASSGNRVGQGPPRRPARASAARPFPTTSAREPRALGRPGRGLGGAARPLRTSTMPVSAWMITRSTPQPGHSCSSSRPAPRHRPAAASYRSPAASRSCRTSPGRCSRPPSARGGAGVRTPLQADRRRDQHRPRGRQHRRRALPLGLHADGRPRERAARDAPRAEAGAARGARRVGRARRPTRGASAPAPGVRERAGSTTSRNPGAAASSSRWARREDQIAATLESAGFTEHRIEALDFTSDYRSAADWWRAQYRRAIQPLRPRRSPSTRRATTSPRSATRSTATPSASPGEGGTLRIPARTWVAWAAA